MVSEHGEAYIHINMTGSYGNMFGRYTVSAYRTLVNNSKYSIFSTLEISCIETQREYLNQLSVLFYVYLGSIENSNKQLFNAE